MTGTPISTPKDPNTAFLIELVGGFFSLLGLGYFYVGRTNEGIIRLIAWLAYIWIGWCMIFVLSFVLIGVLCIPLQLIIQVGVPLWSAMKLKKEMLASTTPNSDMSIMTLPSSPRVEPTMPAPESTDAPPPTI